jgi:hypothetical protein
MVFFDRHTRLQRTPVLHTAFNKGINEATTGSSCHFNVFALQTLQGGSRRREK